MGRRSTKSVRFVSLASTCFLPSRRLTLFLMDNSVATFPNPLKHRNALFDEGDWVKSVLWDGENPARAEYFTRLNLNLNDTQMLLEVQRAQGAFSFWLSSHQRSRRESGRVLTSGLPWRPLETADAAPKRTAPKNILGSAEMLAPRDANLDPFNLSNDKEYEVPKEQRRQIIRQTFGALEVVHAYPAQKLQLPFVSSFHRFVLFQRSGDTDLAFRHLGTRPPLAVQDASLESRHSIFPPARAAIPAERSDLVHQGAVQEEEGQVWAQDQEERGCRSDARDARHYAQGYEQLCPVGILGESAERAGRMVALVSDGSPSADRRLCRRNTRPSFRMSAWGASSSTTTAKNRPKTPLSRSSNSDSRSSSKARTSRRSRSLVSCTRDRPSRRCTTT